MNSCGQLCPKTGQTLSGRVGPTIGVIGGSGLCELPDLVVTEVVDVETRYGKPSVQVAIGNLGGGCVAFLPRHGSGHTIPPHKVPYKANLAALQSLGVSHVVGTCVAGSLRVGLGPGTFVVPDQFINLTWGRDDTYAIDRQLIHLPMARPYCEHIREIIIRELRSMGADCSPDGTVVVIQGPRFSTIAESRMFAHWGGDIVNMTQYPECYFARELGLCYAVVASITDYDVGIPSAVSMQPDSMGEVLKVFRRNTAETLLLVKRLAELSLEIGDCDCAASRMAEYYKLAQE